MALINDFLSLIYPSRCEACGHPLYRHERYICSHCRISLPREGGQNPQEAIGQLFAGRVPLEKAAALFCFGRGGRVQKVLHAVKYQGQKELASWLGNWYRREHQEVLGSIDLFLPVPLHAEKLKHRGYNQSVCFAQGLSDDPSLLLNEDVVCRVKNTDSQTRKKKYQRWESVDGIFEVRTPGMLRNKHVLLVDDVITTGSTIEALWTALEGVEGLRVSVAAIAYAGKT